MIRHEDFAIQVLSDEAGLRIEATHRPTGEVRTSIVSTGSVRERRDRLVDDWKRELYDPSEYRIEFLRTPTGETVCVVHSPSGKRRCAQRRGGVNERETHIRLIDELVTELARERH